MPNLTRRNFFLAVLSLPLINKLVPSIYPRFIGDSLYGGLRGGGKTAAMKLYGVLYHENDGTIGTWCGINRSSPETQKAILEMIKKIQEHD